MKINLTTQQFAVIAQLINSARTNFEEHKLNENIQLNIYKGIVTLYSNDDTLNELYKIFNK